MADYLATAPEDPRATYAQLTRKFQRESGGYRGYRGFWDTVETATPSNVEADGEAMTVSYDVSYRMKDGSRSESSSTLDLVHDGDSYLIDGESPRR